MPVDEKALNQAYAQGHVINYDAPEIERWASIIELYETAKADEQPVPTIQVMGSVSSQEPTDGRLHAPTNRIDKRLRSASAMRNLANEIRSPDSRMVSTDGALARIAEAIAVLLEELP